MYHEGINHNSDHNGDPYQINYHTLDMGNETHSRKSGPQVGLVNYTV